MFILTTKDIELANKVSIRITPATADTLLESANGDEDFKFQFPPLITSDSKSSDWTGDATVAWEPLSIWTGARARKVSIKIVYIVTGGDWGAERIARITREFKRIHYGTAGLVEKGKSTTGKIPTFEIDFYDSLIGSGGAQFKILDMNIGHNETFIDDGGFVWPLKTEITFSGELVTRIGEKQDIANVNTARPKPEWY